MDDISKHKILKLRSKQKLPLPPCWSEPGLKFPPLQPHDRKSPEQQDLLQAGRKTKAGRKAAGSDKAGGADKGPQAESWRVDVGTGGCMPAAEQGSHLAWKLAGPGRMGIGGACVKMPPMSQTSYCVLPPIRLSASVPFSPEEPKTLKCRSTPDDGERTNFSLPPPLSPPTSPLSPPLTTRRPQAQSPPSSPPTLDDPVTRETTPQPLFEAIMSHSQWRLIKTVLLRKNKNIAELEKHLEEMMEWVLHVVNEGVLPAMALYQVHHISQDPMSAASSHSNCVSMSASSQGSDQPDILQGVLRSRRSSSSTQGGLLGNMVQEREEKEACTPSCQESLPLYTQQKECSSASKEEQEEENLQKEVTSPFFSKSATRSPSPRSEANSVASCHDLNLTAQKMLDTVVQMAHSASRSVTDDEDCESDDGSSVSSFDQAEYDLDRLLVSQSTGTRVLQARIDCFSEELIIHLYHLLPETQMGRFPSSCRCHYQPNVQCLEAKQCLDWELFSPLMYNFLHLAFKQLMENFLGLVIFLPDERVPMNDHLKWLWKEDRADSDSNASIDDSDSSDSCLDWSIKFTPGPSQGIVGRNSSQSRLRPSSSASQDQRGALEAISEVLTVKMGDVLHFTCNDPEKAMAIVNKGLDAEAMARLADLLRSSSSEATDQEGTIGSPNPELSLGFTNQEVCQSEKADIIISWLPPRPSETPSLQPGEVLIQEKVWTTSGAQCPAPPDPAGLPARADGTPSPPGVPVDHQRPHPLEARGYSPSESGMDSLDPRRDQPHPGSPAPEPVLQWHRRP
ncbi:uncharacterized protein LOC124485892 [Hypomesus transpacificus]|uniref:uncharacterized protein LOC124485892 n=1 Tax=Hypomesus transpacificus TaxID=137520 RepID=UPI001F07E9E1|nr:uncharacterized protein LOC124485892 [Hypomesus transpacificus]